MTLNWSVAVGIIVILGGTCICIRHRLSKDDDFVNAESIDLEMA